MAEHYAPVVIGTWRNGRPIYLMQGGAPEGDDAGQQETGGQQESAEPTWDALKQAWETNGLTPGQIQARLDASRKWEQRAKALDSDEMKILREKAARADALAADLATDTERAAMEAREAAKSEAAAAFRPKLARAEFKAAAAGRISSDKLDGILAPFGDMSYFLGETGEVDTDKVTSYIDTIAPARGEQQDTRRGPTATGHGTGGTRSTTTAASGRDLWSQQHNGRQPGATTTVTTS